MNEYLCSEILTFDSFLNFVLYLKTGRYSLVVMAYHHCFQINLALSKNSAELREN